MIDLLLAPVKCFINCLFIYGIQLRDLLPDFMFVTRMWNHKYTKYVSHGVVWPLSRFFTSFFLIHFRLKRWISIKTRAAKNIWTDCTFHCFGNGIIINFPIGET